MDHGGRRKAVLGEIRTKVFRHTYITARLQTLDHGAPVSPWTVEREVGHSGTGMIERVYGHLGEVRHGAGVVGIAYVSIGELYGGGSSWSLKRSELTWCYCFRDCFSKRMRQAGFEPTTFGSGGGTGQRPPTLAVVVSGTYASRASASASQRRPKEIHGRGVRPVQVFEEDNQRPEAGEL